FASPSSCPLCLHAALPISTEATLDIIRTHVFNWKIWPDFTQIPSRENPYLLLKPLTVGTTVRLGERAITAVPANHVIPAVGYHRSEEHTSELQSRENLVCR